MENPKNRKHERVSLDVYVNKIVGDEPHLVRVRDISASGVFVYKLLEPELRNAEQIGLEIQLPSSDEIIWAVGEVVRAEAQGDAEGYGVRFTRLAESDRKLIETYVGTPEGATQAA